MHRCAVRKRHGHSIRSLTKTIFTLPFVGKTFFRGIVLSSDLPFGKEAAYELLKKDWLALLATDIDLADEDIMRVYGRRRDIEVFFKMAKQHLKLVKEIQCRD